MNTLIFPTDFSPVAKQAMKYAISISRMFNVRIKLVNTAYVPPTPGEVSLISGEAYLKESQKELDAYLEELKSDPENAGILFETAPCSGPLVEEVNALIEETGAELVVMGTQGATGLEGIFLGSNASRMIRDANCPVLAVPEQAKFDGIKDIVFATDFADPEDEAFVIHELIDFAKPFGAKIHVLHVVDDEHPFTLEQADELASKYPEQFQYENVSFRIQKADTTLEGVNAYVSENRADILAVLTRRRRFFDAIFHRSLAKRMVLEGKIPVLAFHG